MKKKNILWFGMVAVLTLAISAAWIACQQVPNEDQNASLKLNLIIPGAHPAADAAAGGEMKITTAPEVQPAGPGPSWPVYHVKVTLTNPDETFYIYNYVPGVPVSLMVASGSGRVIDVELYEVIAPFSSDYVPAYHYITTNTVMERTLELSGTPVAVTLNMGTDSSTTYIYNSFLPHQVLYGASTAVPLDGSCPYPSYYAWVNDASFGLTFPTFPVTLFDGSSPPNQQNLYIDNFLQNRPYYVEIYHYDAGIYDTMGLFTGATLGTDVGQLNFWGFNENPTMQFSPAQVSGVTPGDSLMVNVTMRGGWGSFTYLNYNYPDDSCGGLEYMPGQWKVFPIPQRTVCVINLYGYDCGGNYAYGHMNVYTKLPPSCNHNSYCDDYMGEDNKNCPYDCYCGDGVCFPPYEDSSNCSSDCRGG